MTVCEVHSQWSVDTQHMGSAIIIILFLLIIIFRPTNQVLLELLDI